MKRIWLTAVLLGVGTFAAPVAHATSGDVVKGGCFYTAVPYAPMPDVYVGYMGDLSATTTGDTPPVPIAATVTCSIVVDGVTAAGTTHSYGDGLAVQAGVDVVTFTAPPTANVTMCETDVFADGSSRSICYVNAPSDIPPQEIADAILAVVDTAGAVVHDVECGDDSSEICSPVCARLKLLAGDYGPLEVAPDGDVYVTDPLALGLNPLYDCPPYRSDR